MRKMCRVLQRQGIDIGREQTARLMRSAGLSGKGQRAKVGHQSQRVSPKARIFALTW
ncbi:IS3 family transposase [Corynebacterium sp. HFH0082]|uniref:IS3 family transposase n=1 Tax=unclassified Corynebacterium TaxID=2624378 RepID=UPI003510714F